MRRRPEPPILELLLPSWLPSLRADRKSELMEGGNRPATARVRQLAVRPFTAWLTEEGELPADPFLGITGPKLDTALDRCWRVQQDIHGHRGGSGDPLYPARRTSHTGAGLPTERQQLRLEALFAREKHVEVEATWGICHRMIAAYREPDRTRGRELMAAVLDPVSNGVPPR
jgi:hypothetical protein